MQAIRTDSSSQDEAIAHLLSQMTLAEKVGQLWQLNAPDHHVPDWMRHLLSEGSIGSVLNAVDVGVTNELQRIAVEESRLGIPLLVGRDVIHGFNTIFPIPLAQAATWNPERVRQGAAIAAAEAAAAGINWTFAPMIDITRDPRWGRIAESLGEDPFLNAALAVAMVQGFQGDDAAAPGAIAACAKHFAGYGASEGGRDYNTASIPDHELHNVHLPPFRAAVEAGVLSLMASFSDLNGVPASGNEWLMRELLRDEWNFEGLVVSDWDSILQLEVHGLTADARDSARAAARAGVDMEMASATYRDHLADLVNQGQVPLATVDAMVANILRMKFELGLFENPYTDVEAIAQKNSWSKLNAACDAAVESMVLLKNQNATLPLVLGELNALAVIGPMADAPEDQMGTWVFDGDPGLSQTPLQALREQCEGQVTLHYAPGVENTRSKHHTGFEAAQEAVSQSDAAIVFVGEEAILSGEAHCRADINLPGAQSALVEHLAALGKPLVVVVMAGRPLTIPELADNVDALLYAWHPGSMAGPAITKVLFGEAVPSGKLPVTFPRMVGQIPIYYAHKNTGKPATAESFVHIDDLDPRAPQHSVGNTCFYLDAGYTPLFPFGFGLSYTCFAYEDLQLSSWQVPLGEAVEVSADLINTGGCEGTEVVQLYVRDPVASVTRPVRELKGFQRVTLKPGERQRVVFTLTTEDLAFHDRNFRRVTEPGRFEVWIGGDSNAALGGAFEVVHSD